MAVVAQHCLPVRQCAELRDLHTLHHEIDLVQTGPLRGQGAGAGFHNLTQGRGYRPLYQIRDGSVAVDHTFDDRTQVVDIRRLGPVPLECVKARDFGGQPVAPAALQVADDQARAVVGEDEVVDAQVAVHDVERVEAPQPIDELEDPCLVGGERVDGRQHVAGGELFEDELAAGRLAEQLDDVGRARAGPALAGEKVANLAGILALLDEMPVGVYGSRGESGKGVADVFGIVLEVGQRWRRRKGADVVADDLVAVLARRQVASRCFSYAARRRRTSSTKGSWPLVWLMLCGRFGGGAVVELNKR